MPPHILEALASGEPLTPAHTAHLASCPSCAAAAKIAQVATRAAAPPLDAAIPSPARLRQRARTQASRRVGAAVVLTVAALGWWGPAWQSPPPAAPAVVEEAPDVMAVLEALEPLLPEEEVADDDEPFLLPIDLLEDHG